MAQLKDDWKGTGSMEQMAQQLNMMARMLNNAQIKMPRNHTGRPAVVDTSGDALIIDLTDSDL